MNDDRVVDLKDGKVTILQTTDADKLYGTLHIKNKADVLSSFVW